MKIKHLVLMILFMCESLMLPAQTKLTLDLEAARKYALEHNKVMLNSNYAYEKSKMALNEAILNGLPQVNASVDYSNALGAKMSIQFNENMPATEIDIKPQSNLYLNVSQLIFSGNYIVGVQTAKLYNQFSSLGRQKTEIEVIAQVTDAYYLVLISEYLNGFLQQNLGNLNKLYDKTSVLEHVGIIEKTDLDQLWIQVNNLQNALTSSERQLELATNLLRLQLGVTVDTEIELTETIDELLAEAGVENDLTKQFVASQNIDSRMLQHQELIGEKMVNMKRANALPNVAAFYRYTHKLIMPNFDMTPKNIVGLQMNIPIVSSGVRHFQTKQAKIDLQTIQNNIALLNDQLNIQEKQLRFNLNNAIDTYNNQKNNVEVSRKVYESLKLKYEQGLISGLDMINADNNYLKAETDHISAMLQVLRSRLELDKLYGEINN
ncbi:MAG: TolC family protein [Bacteroidales bacterium]|nr:TolC family protein [Bacteroidales bacterium]